VDDANGQLNGSRQWRYWLGALFCWLLVVYAVGAKLALYHPQRPGALSVASTKAWQNQDNPSVDVQLAAPVDAPAPLLMTMFASLLGTVFAVVWRISPDEMSPAVRRWFLPSLSVRPPPVI
jgi:hypothetical protein